MSANSVFCSFPDSKILPEKIVADINLGRLTHTKFPKLLLSRREQKLQNFGFGQFL